MASVQGPQSVLESPHVFGCPITWELETFSILSVKKKEWDTEINDACRNPLINQEEETMETNKKPVSVALILDMLTSQLSH